MAHATTTLVLPEQTCPHCGNGLFDCGLPGQPLWCGACATHVARDAAVGRCPACGRKVARPDILLEVPCRWARR